MEKMKKAILDLLIQGKSKNEIVEYINANATEFEGVKSEEISAAVVEALDAHERQKAVSAGFESKEAQKKAAEDKAKFEASVKAEVEKQLAGVKAANPIFAGEGVTKDNSWKSKALQMIRHAARGEKSQAYELSNQFASAYRTKATLRGDSTTVGGFTVPEEWDSEILKIMTAQFAIMAEVRERQTSGDTLNLNAVTIPSVAWVADQDTQYTESNPSFTQSALALRDLTARCNVSNDLLEDSAANIIDELSQVFAEAVGRELGKQWLSGNTSAPDSDPFNGIYFTSGIGSVASLTGSLGYADLINLMKQITGRTAAGSKFFMNFKTLAAVMGIVGTDGQPIVKYDMVSGRPSSMFGFPIVLVDDMANTFNATTDRSTGTSSSIILGDVNKYFGVAVKGGLRIAVSEHIRFDYNQVQVRVLKRCAWGIPSTVASAFARLHTFSV